jgi:hypothetical protein
MKKTLGMAALLCAIAVMPGPALAGCFNLDACIMNCAVQDNACKLNCANQAKQIVDGPILTINNPSSNTYFVTWNNTCTQTYTLPPNGTVKVPQCVRADCTQTTACLYFERNGSIKCSFNPSSMIRNPPYATTITVKSTPLGGCAIPW